MARLATPPNLAMSAARALVAWPVASQQKARRNAMLACTSLTQRRMEHQDVADFLHSLDGTTDDSRSSSQSDAVAHG